MKKMLLASVAAAALIAAPAIAQKQEAPASDVKGAAQPPAAIQNAPAEKIAPAGKVAPDKAVDTKARKSETTGQATPSGRSTDTKANDTKASDTKASDKPATSATPQTRSGASTDPSTRASGNSGALSTEQKAKIRTTVLTANAPRVSSVNFSINIGTVVPRSVRIVAVPATLVEIHPAWRGFMYFVHGDDVIIVEPGTLRIVAVITV